MGAWRSRAFVALAALCPLSGNAARGQEVVGNYVRCTNDGGVDRCSDDE